MKGKMKKYLAACAERDRARLRGMLADLIVLSQAANMALEEEENISAACEDFSFSQAANRIEQLHIQMKHTEWLADEVFADG